MADVLGPILLKLFQVGSKKAKQFIEDGLIRTADDLEKLPQEDLLAIKNIRDQEVLNAAARVSNIKKNIALKNEKLNIEPEVDIFADDIVQDTTDEIKLSNQDIINAANSLPSKETLNNPFFGSFYKDNVDYMNVKNRAELFKKGLEATPEPKKFVMPDYKTRYAISDAKQKYVIDKFQLIKKENPNAIPQDYPSYRNFMIALEKEADQITVENLNNLPEVTSIIPKFKIVPKTKKQSTSEFTGTSFQEDYKNRIYSIWQDKIPDIRAGHELMITRRKEIGDERFLNQVKYPVFFTNSIRNSAHIRLENSLVKLRNRRMELTSGKNLRNRNREKISKIDSIISNIKSDMTTLGLETRLYDPKTKKFKVYGKAFSSPKQLYDSIQQKQKLSFLGSQDETFDVLEQVKPKYVSFEEEGVFLPEGYKEGGLVSFEEVLEY
jgi:hypothetical protein